MGEAHVDDTRAFYDTVAASYARMLPDTSYEAPLDLGVLDHFIALLPESGARVLDAGCGPGRMLDYLHAGHVARVDGVDCSPAMIAAAQASHPDAALSVADIGALPHEAGAFDGVLAWYSIIHTAPTGCARIIEEFARVLAPDGLLLLAYQSGTGERMIDGAYGHDVSLRAYLHDTTFLGELLLRSDFELVASVDRVARHNERHAQGFLIARRR